MRTYRGPFGIPRPLVPPPCQHGLCEVLPSVLSNFRPMTGATCLPPMSKINCRVLYQISLANCKGGISRGISTFGTKLNYGNWLCSWLSLSQPVVAANAAEDTTHCVWLSQLHTQFMENHRGCRAAVDIQATQKVSHNTLGIHLRRCSKASRSQRQNTGESKCRAIRQDLANPLRGVSF